VAGALMEFDADVLQPNPEQRLVVMAGMDAPQRVIAGAGTGKTRTMVWRFVHLVRHFHLDPNRIMAVTFTAKAAGELRERILTALIEERLISSPIEMDAAWIGTFHALAYRILREHCYEVGFDRDVKLTNDLEQAMLVHQLRRSLSNGDVPGAHMLELDAITPERALELTKVMFGTVRKVRGLGLEVDELSRRCLARAGFRKAPEPAPDAPDAELHLLAEREAVDIFIASYRAYHRELAERSAIDFDGVLIGLRNAMRDYQAFAASLREKFQYIIVDEFQDTNTIQYELLSLLAGPRFSTIAAVGDPRQSIYGWRDANIDNIYDFPGEPLALTENYRSNQTILDAANFIIDAGPNDEPVPFSKPLRARIQDGRREAVRLYRAGTPDEEADFVAGSIRQLIDGGRSPNDICILSRVRVLPVAFEQELRRLRIPYLTSGGRGFFDRDEIKDVLAYLRVIHDPLDDQALIRMLQGPAVRLSDRELYALVDTAPAGAENPRMRMWDRLQRSGERGFPDIEPETAERVRATLALCAHVTSIRGSMSLGELIQMILDETGYVRLSACDPAESQRRMANLRKLTRLAGDFESRQLFVGLTEFVQYVELHGDLDVDIAEGTSAEADAVKMMTIHKAKGLEFASVFLVHLRPFWASERDLLIYDGEYGLLLKYFDEAGTENELPRFREWKAQAKTPAKLARDEMRRLVYVALTRARDEVIVTATRKDQADWRSVIAEPECKDPSDDYFHQLAAYIDADLSRGVLVDSEPAHAPIALTPTGAAFTPVPLPRLPELAADRSTNRPKPRPVLSASQIELFEQCALRYRYIYEWRIPAPPDELLPWRTGSEPGESGPRANVFGTLVHQTLQMAHALPVGLPSERALEEIWLAVCDGAIGKHSAIALWNREVHHMLARYRQLPISGFETLSTEREFNLARVVDGHEVMIRGFIDRVCRDTCGRAYLVDYKTTKSIDERARLAYSRQLSVYGAAAAAVFGIECETVLVDLWRGVVLDLGAALGESFGLEWVDDSIRRMVLSDARIPPDKPPCWACAFRVSCPSSQSGWRPVVSAARGADSH
jgi:DNA helicase-2/ATP-dependent DNA helicase PcrA